MEGPLGRAVIGGLVMSTLATLLVVPSIFAVVIGRRTPHSPSLFSGDRESAHFDSDLQTNSQSADLHARQTGPSSHRPEIRFGDS